MITKSVKKLLLALLALSLFAGSAMARTQDPDSASSQFFIMHKNAPHLDGAYAAFGMVVNGIEVVDKIAEVKTNYYDMPLKKVVIKSIRRIK